MKLGIIILGLASLAGAQSAPVHPQVSIVTDPLEGQSVEARCPQQHYHVVDVAHMVKPNMTIEETKAAFESMVCLKDDPPIVLDPKRHQDEMDKHHQLIEEYKAAHPDQK